MDYKGQPRAKNGQFTYGKLGGGSTKGKKAGKIKRPGLSRKEKARVSSGILTDHPKLKPGESSYYFYGKNFYGFTVKGPGEYSFTRRIPIVGNEAAIEQLLKGGK